MPDSGPATSTRDGGDGNGVCLVLAARDRLISVNAYATIALEGGSSIDVRRSAVRRLAKALQRFVDNGEVRDALLGMSDVVLEPSFVTAPEIVQSVADLLAEEHARLLVATGYRTPPPPPASKLLNDTRRAVLEAPYGADFGVCSVARVPEGA